MTLEEDKEVVKRLSGSFDCFVGHNEDCKAIRLIDEFAVSRYDWGKY